MNPRIQDKGSEPASGGRWWRFSFKTLLLVMVTLGMTAPTTAVGSVAIQPDGKIVVASQWPVDPPTLTRNLPTGEVDRSFGDGGRVKLEAPASDVVVQPDGKIVTNVRGILVRYDSDGAKDPTFDDGAHFAGPHLTLLPSGKILTAGTATPACGIHQAIYTGYLVQFNTDGSVDTAFGAGDGEVELKPDPFTCGAKGYGFSDSPSVQPDGRIVVGGGRSDAPTLARFLADGTPDPSFGGGDGVVRPAVAVQDVALAPDGRIVVADARAIGPFTRPGFIVARYLPDGSPDPSFGDAGATETPIGESYTFGPSLVVQPDGKPVIAGQDWLRVSPGPFRVAVALLRYDVSGHLDPSFGAGDGIAVTDLPPPVSTSNVGAPDLAARAGGFIVETPVDFSAPNRGYGRTQALIGYDSDGTLDPGFGDGGIVVYPRLSLCFGRYGPVISSESANGRRLTGTPGPDTLIGTNDDDVIVGLGGNDTIIGMRGDDLICGGDGRDDIRGGNGSDRVRAGAGADHVGGGFGNDTLFGGKGNDLLRGGPGRDRLVGGAGRDQVRS